MKSLRLLLRPTLVGQALGLALPVAGAYLAVVASLGLELYMIGHAEGAKGVAALGLATAFLLVLILAFHAIEIGAQAIIARRFGERNFRAAGAVLDNAILVSFGFGVLLAASLFLLGPAIFATQDADVAALAFEYFRWRIPCIPFVIAVLSMIGFFNGIGKPQVPTIVLSGVLALNAVISYALIFGRFGSAPLGMRGAGLAGSMSSALGFAILLACLASRGLRAEFGCLHFRRNLDVVSMKALLALSAPVFVQQLLGNASIFIFQRINGAIPDGGVSLAASTIAWNGGLLTYLPGVGFGVAAATLVGRHIGSRQGHRARSSALICWGLAAAFMCGIGVLFLCFGERIARAILLRQGGGDAEAVARVAGHLFIIVGAYQVFDSMQAVFSKVLQGAGRTRFVMVASLTTSWLVFLPLAWLLGIALKAGAVGTFGAYGAYLALSALAYLWRFRKADWMETRV